VDPGEHISALRRDGELLAAAAGRAGLDAAVPSCPPWQVRDLLCHLGYVHRWAASYLIEQRREIADELSEAEQLRAGPGDAELLGWFRLGHAALADALSTADPDVVCWTFLAAPSALAFWARRQAHETAIHRADAELACGSVTGYDADFAADGIDELLIAFFGRDENAADAAAVIPGRSLLVRATDVGRDWHVWLTATGERVLRTGRGRPPAEPDCTLSGCASGLYLALWNRSEPEAAGLAVGGEAAVVAAWQAGMKVGWD
jgi:uncharacterized protein (TIGR03083 family)